MKPLSVTESLASAFSTSAAAILQPFDALPSSRFHAFSPFPSSLRQLHVEERARQLRQAFNISRSDDSPSSLACDCLASHLCLSSQVLLPRAIEPDEPTDAPNQPQAAAEDPPGLHLSYLRPIVSDTPDEGQDSDNNNADGLSDLLNGRRRKRKPSLNGLGTRLLLAEWHIGSDPRSYIWSNPYEGEKEKDDPYSQYSQSQLHRGKGKSKKKRNGESLSRESQGIPTFSQSRFDFPSSFPSSAPPSSSQSYFPSLNIPPTLGSVLEEGPASSSQDGWSRAPQTQPVISVTGPEASLSRFTGVNSQVVPGVFGSRNASGVNGKAKEKEKKKAKKRVSGF